jgi:hypothetical protein
VGGGWVRKSSFALLNACALTINWCVIEDVRQRGLGDETTMGMRANMRGGACKGQEVLRMIGRETESEGYAVENKGKEKRGLLRCLVCLKGMARRGKMSGACIGA